MLNVKRHGARGAREKRHSTDLSAVGARTRSLIWVRPDYHLTVYPPVIAPLRDTTRIMMSARLIVQCSESIAQHRFSDESFRLCDIKFDHPQIGVVAAAARPVIGDCLRLPGGANGNQRGRPVRADTAFERARVLAAILRDHQDRAGGGVPLGDHRRKATCRVRPPHQCVDQRTARQPRAQPLYPGKLASAIFDRMKVPVPRAASSPLESISRASPTNTRRCPLIQRPSATISPALNGRVNSRLNAVVSRKRSVTRLLQA